MRTLLIDGEMIAWSAAFRLDGDAAGGAVHAVRRLCRDLDGDRAIVCLSDPSHRYWRHDLFADYKPNRPEGPPAGLAPALAALRSEFICRELPALEADDVMGILATHAGIEGERVMVAVDKDLLTIPGLHFNPKRPADGVTDVSARDAGFNHLAQALTGDSSDGYPGCPGVGPKTVRRILWGDDPALWWKQVLLAFQRKRLGEADALLQARLARILHAEDYDIAAARVTPWEPARAATAVHAGGAA